MSGLWKTLARRRRPAPSVRSARPRPQLEYLEDRLVPAIINVNSTADIPLNQLPTGVVTLRDAIQIANTNGDTSNTINLTLPGTYTIGLAGTPGETDNQAGEFAIFTNANVNQTGLSLTIQNASGGNVVINGNSVARVFDINPNNVTPGSNTVLGAVTISGVTIENGLAQPGDAAGGSGGGIRDQGPVDLTLTNDTLTGNSASADGGGVSMENAPVSTKWVLDLNNTTVSNNHAGDAGGGVEVDGSGGVNINNSYIVGNSCLNQGAGVWLDAIGASGANLNVTNTLVADNTAGLLGGGLGNAGNGTVTITGSTIQGNATSGFGGGFADQNNLGTLVVQNSLFLNNSAGTNGGGIQEGGPSTTITNSELKANAAGINGGTPNPLQGSGGGLFINGGTLLLTSSTLADNTTTINGGGIELQTTTASTITNSTLAGNSALNNAGGNNGGGLDDVASGTLALVDDTLSNNYAVNGGGVFWNGNVTLSVQNTIIAANIAGTAGPDANNPAGNFTDSGGNLIGVSGAGSGNTGFTAGTTQTGTVANPLNPLLAPLTNNGGPLAGSPGHQITLETEAELPGSPALAKGLANGITTDERGVSRGGTSDVGAFQNARASLQLTINAPPFVPLGGTANITVTVTNASSNPLPADNNTTLTVTNSFFLVPNGPLTFAVGPLAAGQSASFTYSVTGTDFGIQTITASVTGPDMNPATVSTSSQVTVAQQFSPPPIAPVGGLTPFAIGLGPTGVDLFDVDSQGQVFAVSFLGAMGTPVFVNTAVQFSLAALQDTGLVALLRGVSQQFLVEVVNPFNPFVLPAILSALHL